jgi:NAD(P)-dependent dehydrogenase (short-subunit alcohol dehydrogenase family)
MPGQLNGKTALIAGAGRNNGKAIALTFAREGADLILVARKLGDELNQVARECEALGAKTLAILADVGDHAAVERVVEQGLQRFGKVDVLASVAAIRPHRNFWEISNEEWLQVFAVNLHSTFYLAKALAPGMKERRSGSIFALGGVASLTSEAIGSAVVASKHGLYGLIKSLALELGPYGIRANLLALSNIENQRRNPEWYADRTGDAVMNVRGGDPNSSPLRRNGTPQEVANAALFLASDQSSYVTGDRLLCAGGKYM